MGYLKKGLASLGVALGATSALVGVALAQTDYQRDLEGTTINVLAVQMPQYQPLWAMIPEFEEQYGIRVNLEETGFDQMRERTLLDMSRGTGRYDVFTVDVMWLAEYTTAGYLEPLTPYIENPDLTEDDYDVDDFLPRIYSGTGVWDDVMYNIPIGAGVVGHVFRRSMMEDAGLAIPDHFDMTTDYFMEVIETLDNPDAGVSGYVSQPERWHWGWTFTQLMYTFQSEESQGNEFVDEDWNVTINSPENLAALEWYIGLRDYGPDGSASFGYPEMLSLYQQGQAAGAMSYTEFVGGDLEASDLQVSGDNVYFHTAVGPDGILDPWFGSWGLGMSSDSGNKEAAWTFIQWITAKEQSLRAVSEVTAPVRHSTFTSDEVAENQPYHGVNYDFMLETTNPDERIRVPEWAEISDVMGLYGTQAWVGEITPEQALENMATGMEAAFRRGGYYNEGADNPPQHWRDLSYYDRLPSEWD